MDDNLPVYLISTNDYENNYSVVGEGLPAGRQKIGNDCYVQARIEYDFTDSNGNLLKKEQILDQYWKDDLLNELMDKYKSDKNIRLRMEKIIESEYKSGEYPRTIGDRWKLVNKLKKLIKE